MLSLHPSPCTSPARLTHYFTGSKTSDIEKYNYLATVQDGNEDLYFAALVNHTVECMPIVYTPTVGQACMSWNKIYRHTPRGLYIRCDIYDFRETHTLMHGVHTDCSAGLYWEHGLQTCPS